MSSQMNGFTTTTPRKKDIDPNKENLWYVRLKNWYFMVVAFAFLQFLLFMDIYEMHFTWFMRFFIIPLCEKIEIWEKSVWWLAVWGRCKNQKCTMIHFFSFCFCIFPITLPCLPIFFFNFTWFNQIMWFNFGCMLIEPMRKSKWKLQRNKCSMKETKFIKNMKLFLDNGQLQCINISIWGWNCRIDHRNLIVLCLKTLNGSKAGFSLHDKYLFGGLRHQVKWDNAHQIQIRCIGNDWQSPFLDEIVQYWQKWKPYKIVDFLFIFKYNTLNFFNPLFTDKKICHSASFFSK